MKRIIQILCVMWAVAMPQLALGEGPAEVAHFQYDLSAGKDGDALLRINSTLSGYRVEEVESFLSHPDAYAEYRTSMLNGFRGEEVVVETLPTLTKDAETGEVEITEHYRIRNGWHFDEDTGEWYFCLNETVFESLFPVPEESDDTTPINLKPAANLFFEMTVTLPKEKKKWFYEDKNEYLGGSFIDVHYNRRYTDGMLHYQYLVQGLKDKVPTAYYDAYAVEFDRFEELTPSWKIAYKPFSVWHFLRPGYVVTLILVCFSAYCFWRAVMMIWENFRASKSSERIRVELDELRYTHRFNAPVEAVWDVVASLKHTPYLISVYRLDDNKTPWKTEDMVEGASYVAHSSMYCGLRKFTQTYRVIKADKPHRYEVHMAKQPIFGVGLAAIMSESHEWVEFSHDAGVTSVTFSLKLSYEHPLGMRMPMHGAKQRLDKYFRRYARNIRRAL